MVRGQRLRSPLNSSRAATKDDVGRSRTSTHAAATVAAAVPSRRSMTPRAGVKHHLSGASKGRDGSSYSYLSGTITRTKGSQGTVMTARAMGDADEMLASKANAGAAS
eukprot:6181276-Pleurochrysis_carterae.AAC.3